MSTRVAFTVAACAMAESTAQPPTHEDPQRIWHAWEAGNVEEARQGASQLLNTPKLGSEARHLLFLTSFVEGQCEQALGHYEKIAAHYPRRSELDEPVLDAYLHLGRYYHAEQFARGQGMAAEKLAVVSKRRDHRLSVNLAEMTVIPFADHPLTAYFPAFHCQINGTDTTAHVDTGGTFLIMGPDRARKLGIELIEAGQGYHGATRMPMSFGIAECFQLGSAVLENVPVSTLASLQGPQDFVIFGTNVLQRFLSTLDYPNRRLILSPRGNTSQRERHLATLPSARTRVPFYMWGDHYMFAQGAIGEHRGLNFFIDSGLVSLHPDGKGGLRQAAFTTPKDKFTAWGYDADKLSGPFESHLPLSLGPLTQSKLLFIPGKVGDTSYGGVRIDGLLSHAFLSQYAWTLDFDERRFTFSRERE